MQLLSHRHSSEIAFESGSAAPLPGPLGLVFSESEPHAEPAWSSGVHLESLANLAHELRTPIQVLFGYLDILRDDHPDDPGDLSESPERTIFERMNSNVHELAQTVENVLAFALAYAGAETAIEEEVELAEFFAELDEVLKASNHNPNLAVRVNLDGAPRTIFTQRRLLRSIVVNLAVNAIKFTAGGAVTISMRRCAHDPQQLAIEVRDTGAGIDRGLLSFAFEPLVQLSHSSVRRHRGLGLGLTVVQRNVKALGGKLEVESVLNAGSCFRVTIPCSSGEPSVHFMSPA